MKNKSKRLINNTIIFFIGSLGSKFIQFFLVPLYTYVLTTEQCINASFFAFYSGWLITFWIR